MEHEPVWKQKFNRCKHFNGVMNENCKAGVAYHQFVGSGLKGFPCFRENNPAITCTLLSWRTEEEAKAEAAEITARVNAHFEKLSKVISGESNKCPECDQEMTMHQVGRCVYARPCGHRLYQGKVPKKAGGK